MIDANELATQKQMERVWGSEWEIVGMCDHKPCRLKNLDKWQKYGCKKCGYSAGRKKLSFCPSCGAAMTPEALEIIKKRLEEMNNGEND